MAETSNVKKKYKDSELKENYDKFMKDNNLFDETAYYNGAYYEINGLDVKNLKNPIFDK